MKNVKHTPGPWTVGYNDNQCVYSDYRQVASVQCNQKEWEANARLIAAAPELLEALKEVLAWASYGVPNARKEQMRKAVGGAIAKAEGRD